MIITKKWDGKREARTRSVRIAAQVEKNNEKDRDVVMILE